MNAILYPYRHFYQTGTILRLTHIKLSGFKSFVDPTTISVPGQLVAVIGPNGCGKSNVIDAVRWVLGEASARQLRGQSMQDVIFNGSDTRKSVSRAAVELVFDNTDHQLQGAWGQYTEIAIKRILTRQGDSSYYINNQIVRRKDIIDLFLGTGVGARGYAVIEQGMISRIIEARPEELRAYLEEAAGVSKYKERRRETEQRLGDTQTNLNRLRDLQGELERQIEKLEHQATLAARYQELTRSLNDKQNLLTFIRLSEAQASVQQTNVLVQQHQTELARLEMSLNGLNEASYQQQLIEHETQQTLHQTQNQWALIREQRARLEEQIRYQQTVHQRLNDEKLKTDNELGELQQTEQKQLQQLALLETQLSEQQCTLSEYQMQLEGIQEQLPLYEEQLQQLEHTFLNQNSEQNSLQRALDLSLQKEKQLVEQLGTIALRQQNLNTEIKTLAMPTQEEIETVQELLLLAQIKEETLTEQADEQERLFNQRQIVLDEVLQQFNRLNTQKITLQAQKNALAQLSVHEQQNHTRFWAEQNLNEAPALWQKIHVDAKWQYALSVFLGERLYARSVKLDPATHTPESQTVWINPESPHTDTENTIQVQMLSRFIQAEAPFDLALNAWLQNIVCAQSVPEALTQTDTLTSGQIFITPEGHLVDRLSVYWQGSSQTKNQLSWQNDINQIDSELLTIEPMLEKTRQEQQTLQQALQETKQQSAVLRIHIKENSQDIQSIQQKHTRLLDRHAQTQLRYQYIEQEQVSLGEQQQQTQQQRKQENSLIEEKERALSSIQQDAQNTNSLRSQAQQELQSLRTKMYDVSRKVNSEQLIEQKLLQQTEYNQQQLTQTRQKRQLLSERQTELNLEFNEHTHIQELLLNLEQLIDSQNQLEETLAQIQNQLASLQEQNKQAHSTQNTLLQEQQKQQQDLHNTLLTQQQAQLLVERLQEDLNKNKAHIAHLQEERYRAPEPEELAQEITRLAKSIERLGAVNLVALEELAQAQERQAYFNAQTDDLLQAMASLKNAIEQIDEESKTLFKQTFEAVNQKIQQYFPTLFGGGQANLEMVGDDLLHSGISIMAHPPGKKNSTIHLLSGGEKALTAMSLVFALFGLNPAPFCLLDEVDAPLDDANTGRFCQLVQQMSENTQFLFISHNRLTMQMADQLIGVTMQEKGVSRIVSVDIQEALAMQQTEHSS